MGNEDDSDSKTPPRQTSRSERISKACDYCSQRRRKCTGGRPCERCEDAGLVCKYSSGSRRTRTAKEMKEAKKKKEQNSPVPSPKKSPAIATNLAFPSSTVSLSAYPQQGQFSYPNYYQSQPVYPVYAYPQPIMQTQTPYQPPYRPNYAHSYPPNGNFMYATTTNPSYTSQFMSTSPPYSSQSNQIPTTLQHIPTTTPGYVYPITRPPI